MSFLTSQVILVMRYFLNQGAAEIDIGYLLKNSVENDIKKAF